MNSSRWPALRALDSGRAAFGHQFARHHEAQPIALLGFFQIVGGHENRGARVGQPVDHGPEGTARQRIHAGGRLVEKQDARFVQDRRAERHALFPSLRQAADQLNFSALQPRERNHPAHFLRALVFGNAVDAGEEFEVFRDRQVVVERKLLRHVADLLPHLGGTQAAALARQLHARRCVGGSRPQSILMVVVLPAPFAPSRP